MSSATKGEQSEAATTAAPAPRRIWPEFARVRSWSPLDAEPFLSRGHAGRYLARVRVNPEAERAYRNLVAGTAFPAGTVVAKFHEHRDGTPADVFVVERTNQRWRFLVLSAEGELTGSASVTLCARCHAEAPAAPLFGLPDPRNDSGPAGVETN